MSVADNTTTSYSAISTTPALNVSPCSAAVTYTEDSDAPNAPGIALGSPARSNDNRAIVRGQAASGAQILVFRGTDCQGTPAATGTGAQLAAGGFTITVADNTAIQLRAVARDAASNTSRCSDPIGYVEDSIAPNTRITFGPAFKTRDRTPTFRFLDETEDVTTTFQCKIDRKSWRTCRSPKTFKRLRPGRHTIRVRARDAAGNQEALLVKRRFKVVR